MIRVQLFSDLHCEFGPRKPISIGPDIDLVVVPGDVAEGCRNAFVDLRKIVPRTIFILFVAGNHEMHRRFLSEEIAAARQAAPGFDIAFLEENRFDFGGVRFLGATCWTDYRLFGDHNAAAAMSAARRGMRDHRKIGWHRNPWRRFRPQEAALLHSRARFFLSTAIAEPHPGPTVVVTHMAPSIRSLPDGVRFDPLAASYASSIGEDLLTDARSPAADRLSSVPRVDFWLHGHVHARSDYKIGASRVVCNPHGYGHEATGFDPCLVLEIGQ